MRLKVFLDKLKVLSRDTIEIEMAVISNTDRLPLLQHLQGIYLSEQNGDERFLLSTVFQISEEKLTFKISLDQLSFIEKKANLTLIFKIDHGVEAVPIMNRLTNDVLLYFSGAIYRVQKSESLPLVFLEKKKAKDLTVKAEKVTTTSENHFFVNGTFHVVLANEELKLKQFYLLNKVTKEKIFLKSKVNGQNFALEMNVDADTLYEGNCWQLHCHVVIGAQSYMLKVISYQEEKMKGKYFKYNQSLHYQELFTNKNHELLFRITKNQKRLIKTDITDVMISENNLTIEGKASFKSKLTSEDRITDLIFIHRESMKEQFFPLTDWEGSNFCVTIHLEEEKFINEKGTWDLYVAYVVNGVIDYVRLKRPLKQEQNGKMVILPGTAHNGETIRSLRPYITVNNNLALIVKDEVLKCDIHTIDYDNTAIMIKGYLYIPGVSYILKEIYLKDVSDDRVLNGVNEIKGNNDRFIFECSYDWDSYEVKSTNSDHFNYVAKVQVGDTEYDMCLVSNLNDIPNKAKVMIYPTITNERNGYVIEVQPYYTNNNELRISVANYVKAICKEIKPGKRNIRLLIELQTRNHFSTRDAMLKLVNKKGEVITKTPDDKKDNVFIFNIGPQMMSGSEIALEGNWDPYLVFDIQGKEVEKRIYGDHPQLIAKNSTFISNAVKLVNDQSFSAFFNPKGKGLYIEIRELKAYEKERELFKFSLARGVAKFMRRFNRKPVWFIGENLGEVAQDNGFAFFEYCMKQNKPENIYYVSTDDNKDAEKLMPYSSHVLKYDSFKHYVMYWLSEYLIVSHGIRDVIPSVIHNRMKTNPKKVIYLQHGITAMKRLTFNRDSYNGMIKKFVVCSPQERDIFINENNFKKSQPVVTGFARFDTLVDKSKKKKKKQILLIPTWREWVIKSGEDFLESAFYKHYHDLLMDEELGELLEKNDLVLKFYPHIEMQRRYKDYFIFPNKRIKMVNLGQESVKQLMQDSSLMITDYSSVAFDFNYMKKPTIFYHFDLNDYLHHRGSYIDLREDLIGDTAYTKEEVLKYITEYVESNFKYKPKFLVKSKNFYTYQDKSNSKRIYTEIKKLSKSKGGKKS